MLSFNEAPSISNEWFMDFCRQQCSDNDLKVLQNTKLAPEETKSGNSFLDQWNKWESSLRFSIAEKRVNNVDFTFEIPKKTSFSTDVLQISTKVLNEQNPCHAEVMLDDARWSFIETIEYGNFFNFNNLVAYSLKLQLLKRKFSMTQIKGKEEFERIYNEQKNVFSDIILQKK